MQHESHECSAELSLQQLLCAVHRCIVIHRKLHELFVMARNYEGKASRHKVQLSSRKATLKDCSIILSSTKNF
jgi:hypothetical protein